MVFAGLPPFPPTAPTLKVDLFDQLFQKPQMT